MNLQAVEAARPHWPIANWRSLQARTLAGRLASNLGGYRLGGVLHWLAWRSEPKDPNLAAYYGHTLLHRRGPLAAFEFLEGFGEVPSDAEPESAMHLLSLRATVAGHLRDFSTAESCYARAAERAPRHPWLVTVRSHLFELEDRYEAALEAARDSLALQPWFRPGVQALAHVLQLLDRDAEAMTLLSEAAERIESMHVLRQLAALQEEHQLYEESARTLAGLERLAPLMEKAERLWLRRQRVTLACLRGQTQEALAGAKAIDEPYYRELAERLESSAALRRVRLEVPFVRQHHMTCAPATLAALSRFWKLPAEHLEVAEAICYDGTPIHSERHWAESHGYAVREFRVTWESAVALLDRGIPFTLTTTGATSGHLQAVVGYDALRRTLLIRDPFLYTTGEFVVEPLLEACRATGPRGMAMVPFDQQERLTGLDLPETEPADGFYAVNRALAVHRRDEALAACGRMLEKWPGHRLTLNARRALAAYDANTPALLECLEGLLNLFPQDAHLNLAKLACLRDLSRREERLRLLEGLCTAAGTNPVFWQQYAQELRADAGQRAAASTWIRWALRYRPSDPVLIGSWADLLWDRREFERAASYYRLSACLGEANEAFSRNFFIAARHLRQTEAALDLLRSRNQALGGKSAAPALTLVEALQHTGQGAEAERVLEEALRRRPQDGALRLFAADLNGRHSRFSIARQLLEEAKPDCSPAEWHRTAAALANYQNLKPQALEHWRQVLALQPLAHDAIRAAALLLAEIEGRLSALQFLDSLCERFSCSVPILALRVEWLRQDGPSSALPRLRELLAANPAEAWGWRELALQLAANRQPLEALEAAGEAIRLEPNQSRGYTVRAEVRLHQEELAPAREDLRTALRLEVDNEFAMAHWVSTAPTLAERRNALQVVGEELRRQVIFQNALYAYQQVARGVLPPQEVLGMLREAHQARPDLWQAWSVLVCQLTDMASHDDAEALARQATAIFPLIPRLWVDLARVEQARLNRAGEIAALEKALELEAAYAEAAQQLAGLYDRQREWSKAREILERAIAANPLDAINHGCLAQVLWQSNQRDEAIERVQHAIRLQPGYEWAWTSLREWAAAAGRPGLALEMARDLTRLRAGEARSWLLLAKCLMPDAQPGTPTATTLAVQEVFSALARALELNPRSEEAYDRRARLLAQLNRFEEALADCRPKAFSTVPVRLQIRAAWLEAQRGNLAQAILQAKATLAEHPDHLGGWQLLADWCWQVQDGDEAVKAAERMVALAPLEAVPLGYLGDLKRKLGDDPGARTAFARAFSLDPQYEFAGFQLFELQLKHQELAEAGETLQRLQRRGESAQTLACAVILAVARSELQPALQTLESLCLLEEADLPSLSTATESLDRAGCLSAVDATLEKCVQLPGCSPALAGFFVHRHCARGRWNLHSRLRALNPEEGGAGRQAVIAYLDRLGHAFSSGNTNDLPRRIELRFHLWRLLRRHRQWLREDTLGWGKVGYVLACVGNPAPVIAWLSDWSTRPAVESWMLYNLVIVLHRKRRFEEARDVIRHAVSLRHSEDLYGIFRVWAAFEAALRGELDEARQHLAGIPMDGLPEEARPLGALTRLLLDLRGGQLESPFRQVRTSLKAAFGTKYPHATVIYVRTAYHRFIKAAAPLAGGWKLRAWSFCFYHWK